MNTTHQVTIRGIDNTTKQRLLARARQRGLSLNAYNLALLRKEVGTTSPKGTNGLERFIGIAPLDSKVEAALQDQHRVTPDKWDANGL